MKFLLFNLVVAAALIYLVLRGGPATVSTPSPPPAVASAPETKPAPAPPPVEAEIEVKPAVVRPPHPADPPAAPDRRRELDRIIRDMDALAARKLGQ
jgi:hypothetical protein